MSVEVLPIAASARDLRREEVRPGGDLAAGGARHRCLRRASRACACARLRPDLVHTNSLKAGVYGSIAARAAGVPLVWHVRDRIAEDYIPRAAVRLVRILIGHLADGVIANSDRHAGRRCRPTLRGETSWVIPAAVEPPPDVRGRAASSHATTFGMLGRIAPWKGQDLFLRAFAVAFAGRRGAGGGGRRGDVRGGELRARAACARGAPRDSPSA